MKNGYLFILRAGVALFFLLRLNAAPAYAGETGPGGFEPRLARSEFVTGQTPRNFRLLTQDGEQMPLYKLKGAPALISFMYIDCNGPCHLINQSIKNLLHKMDPAVAGSVTVLSVSLDSQNDSPSKLKEYGAQFSTGLDNWIFATAERETIDELVLDLGFFYEKKGGGYEHLNRLTLLNSEGKVIRHFYGVDYDVGEVEAAIKASQSAGVTGSISRAVNSLTLFCSTYDPATKTYRVNPFLIVSWGIQYLLVMATLIYIFRGRIGRFTASVLRLCRAA
ncbi:MAG: SCO family protein [Nitrospinae bacterium]|nr:SCO family protein [Nitrospinota bacterium]